MLTAEKQLQLCNIHILKYLVDQYRNTLIKDNDKWVGSYALIY